MKRDDGLSEIVSFILIIAVLTAVIAVFVTVALPEIEKADRIDSEKQIVSRFCELKTGIDQLWLFERTKSQTLLLPKTGGSVLFAKSDIRPSITFDHTSGQTTASLLTLTCESEGTPLVTYEGGAVFSRKQLTLPASVGQGHLILITAAKETEELSTNRPVLLHYSQCGITTYTNVSKIQISSEFSSYWRKELAGVSTITLVECTITPEAVT